MKRVWIVLIGLAACNGEAESDTAFFFCEDAPMLTWDNFGRGFTKQNCQSCHASTSPDRHSAPPTVTFDTEQDVAVHRNRMLGAVAGEFAYMPPQGGISDDDRYRFEVWLTCFPPEP